MFGTKPMISTAVPTASHPVRQVPCSIAACAISGRLTNPAICASVATATANARRETNQLLTAP
jgi:hypothetical protein